MAMAWLLTLGSAWLAGEGRLESPSGLGENHSHRIAVKVEHAMFPSKTAGENISLYPFAFWQLLALLLCGYVTPILAFIFIWPSP